MTVLLRHMLTVQQVADQMGVSYGAVSFWCRNGMIFPMTKIGRTYLIEPGFRFISGGRRGRPIGSKNKKPYPVGVKRPRKPQPGDVLLSDDV